MDEFHARRLVDLYADTILRISYSYLKQTCDAEDICQTVFLKYLTNDCTFDSIDHEKAWIIRTTINACKDYLKSAHFRRTPTPPSHLQPQPPPSRAPGGGGGGGGGPPPAGAGHGSFRRAEAAAGAVPDIPVPVLL